MKYASQKRILLEIALIKLCRPQTEGDLGSLLDRIRQLEEKLEQGALPVRKEDVKEAQTKKQKEEKHPQQIPKAVPDEVRETVKSWKNIISAMPGLSRSYLAKAGLTAGSEVKSTVNCPSSLPSVRSLSTIATAFATSCPATKPNRSANTSASAAPSTSKTRS